MNIACTGFVSEDAGSIASANALLLRALLKAGVEVDFFSKPSFVDPRPIVGNAERFRFIPVVNSIQDAIRRKTAGIPLANAASGRLDSVSYNHLLVRRIREEHSRRSYNAVLWMGDYAAGGVPGVPTISFAQGPPGTDARSVIRRRREVQRFAGRWNALKWELLARLRLSSLGLPKFLYTDHFIVASSISKQTLCEQYRVPAGRISTLSYPIDLELFRPSPAGGRPATDQQLRLLWLGRIIPRKRLDLFLEGAATAIRRGLNLELTVVGRVGFVAGYEKVIHQWPHPERLTWVEKIPRADIPEIIRQHDVLVQPSEEEDFGSSVAEAQACGIPVIIGHSNGNGDYLGKRDIWLPDDRPETFADKLQEMESRKRQGQWGDPMNSRATAMRHFDVNSITERLLTIIEQVVNRHSAGNN